MSNRLILDYKIQTVHQLSYTNVQEKIRLEVLTWVDSFATKDSFYSDTTDCFYLSEQIALVVFERMMLQRPITEDAAASFDSFAAFSHLETFALYHPNLFQEFFLTFKKLARIHGVSVAVVWFSTELAQILAITYLTAIGYPEIAVLAPFVPLSFFNTGVAISLKSIRHNIKLKKGYGSRTKKRKGQKIIRQTHRTFKIKNKNSFLHCLDTLENKALITTINKNNFLIEMGSALRLNKRKLYYQNVNRFAKKNLPKSDFQTMKMGMKDLNKELKVVLMLEAIKQKDSIYDLIPTRFRKSVSQVPLIAYNNCSIEAKYWVFMAFELKNFTEFENLINKIPSNLITEEVLDYFDSVILPYWSENLKKVGFRKFRKIVKGVAQTRYDTLNKSHLNWNKDLSQLLLSNCEY